MTELLTVLRALINQKLRGVSEDKQGNIHLHFDDWVLITKELYAAPIIERLSYQMTG